MQSNLMPVGFVGHGAPLIATNQEKGADLVRWALSMPTPTAVLVVSAHWQTRQATLGTVETLPLIYDFSGFPTDLYRIQYPAPGAPALADRVAALTGAQQETQRGLDHGVWTPLVWMYPRADVPVLQLSLPRISAAELHQLGEALAPLRQEGVLLLTSGNLTHNLGEIDYSDSQPPPEWATAFDSWVADALTRGDVGAVLSYRERAPHAARNHPTEEHFTPLFVALGAAGDSPATFPYTGWEFGSLSRRAVQFG